MEIATKREVIKESDLKFHLPIGRGASGDVFLVTWKSKQGEIQAAAKKVPRLSGKTVEEQLGNEIKYLEKLDHQNIIKFYGTVTTDSYVIILTEYATNGCLHDYLHKLKRLPLYLIIRWAIEAAEGIEYLQENQVLHRDIKSPNFLITAAKTLKLCDFGVAKDLTSTKTTESSKGTIRWIAPEVYKDGKLSPKADIFAFGIVLSELVTCKVPYEGIRSERVMWYVGLHDMRPEIPEDCPPELRELMIRCWNTDREKRPNIGDILMTLRKFQSGLKWTLQRTLKIRGEPISSLHWISDNDIAVCVSNSVRVYEVSDLGAESADTAPDLYESTEWNGHTVMGVATNDVMSKSLLAVCRSRPYVYQFPRQKSRGKKSKKYRISIPIDKVNPMCIVADAQKVVIGLGRRVVISSPSIEHQVYKQTTFQTRDLSIMPNFFFLMGDKVIEVVTLSTRQTIFEIKANDYEQFLGICSVNDGKHLFVAIQRDTVYSVYRYDWNGIGNPNYAIPPICTIHDLNEIREGCLSVRDGMLAVGLKNPDEVHVYTLN